MKVLRGFALLLGGSLASAVLLVPVRYFALPLPFSFFAPILAVGLPAFFTAPLAHRWRLPFPIAWSVLGYSLGSGIATGTLLIGSPGERFSAGLVNAASLTLLGPAGLYLGNLLWLIAAGMMGYYGLETYQGRGPVPREPEK